MITRSEHDCTSCKGIIRKGKYYFLWHSKREESLGGHVQSVQSSIFNLGTPVFNERD